MSRFALGSLPDERPAEVLCVLLLGHDLGADAVGMRKVDGLLHVGTLRVLVCLLCVLPVYFVFFLFTLAFYHTFYHRSITKDNPCLRFFQGTLTGKRACN